MSKSDSSSSSLRPTEMVQSPAKREKKVYFCVEKISVDCKTGTYQWYAIDDNDDTVEGEEPNKLVKPPEVVELKPVFDSPNSSDDSSNSHHYLCGFAAWKSFICIFGGCDLSDPEFTPLSNVFYIDTSHPPEEVDWKRGPNLLKPRDTPHGVVYNGKIWALGGSQDLFPIYGESLQSPFSENNWVPLYMDLDNNAAYDALPDTVSGHAIFSNKLYVYGTPTDALHCYDINARKWSVAEKDFGRWQYQCAFIDEIMYLVEGRKFMGFDLRNNAWYKGVGLKEDTMLPFTIDEIDRGFFSTLVHIGNGILCLLWNSRVSIEHSTINCTKFTVSKVYDHTEGSFIIQANVRSFKLYKIHVGFLSGSLAVCTGEGNEKKNKKSQHKKEE